VFREQEQQDNDFERIVHCPGLTETERPVAELTEW
jgi:hypothetical protein